MFPLLTSTWTQGIYARQNVKFHHTAGNVQWRRWNCISCCQRWEQIACRLNLQLYPVNTLNLWKGLCENQIKAQVSACLWMTNLDLLLALTVSTTPLKRSSSGVPWTSSPPLFKVTFTGSLQIWCFMNPKQKWEYSVVFFISWQASDSRGVDGGEDIKVQLENL